MHFNPSLRKGILSVFLLLIITIIVNITLPNQVSISHYHTVDEEELLENQIEFEGLLISTEIIVESLDVLENGSVRITTSLGLILLCPSSMASLSEGNLLLIRGSSFLYSEGYIEVTEFFIVDALAPYLRSIPGIILFIILFFVVFRFDLHKQAFVSRRTYDA